MPRIHVCALSKVEETVLATGARTLVTLINADTEVDRPAEIAAERHLFVGMSDITEDMKGHVLPAQAHVLQLLRFMRNWDRAQPVVVHCYAGVSRSTAAAYISYCALRPAACEYETARLIREISPTATPNSRLVEIADAMLGRQGRMIDAVRAIGRGQDCFEGQPFALDVA
ncbi:MAG: protein tyrosine phosphatase [Hyphomicrobiales bacterium]|nr:protein tyrosine phosphatase [Hyphomicrobiales bacterium]